MSIFDRLFGRTKKEPPTCYGTHPSENRTDAGHITDCRLWKCPKCGELLEKGGLGTVWIPFDPISKVAGTGTCAKCGAEFPQSDIYGGRFDVRTPVSSVKVTEQPEEVSIVVFRIRSSEPPSDAKSYCRRVLTKKYPNANMESHYIVGFADDLTTAEALALYQDFVRKGQLPDLGRQIDSLQGAGPEQDSIVALFFA